MDIRKSENNSGLVNKAGKIVDNNGAIIKDIEFTINDGKNDFEIKISKDEGITINDIVKTINTAKKTVNGKEVSLEAKASYDANIGRFFLQTTETGEDAKIKINVEDDISRYFIDALKLTNGGEKDVDNEIKFYTIGGEEIAGQDAVINFNGAEGITSSTNRITINGITMDLTGTGEFTINVSTDVDAVYEK